MGSILAKLAQALIVIRPMALGFFECKTYFVFYHGEKRKKMGDVSNNGTCIPTDAFFFKAPQNTKATIFLVIFLLGTLQI
jgi:hypothetical protein